MSRTKRLVLALLVLLGGGLALFFALVPVRTSTTALTLSILEHKTGSSMSQDFFDTARPLLEEGAVFDSVYLLEQDYLLGGTTTTLFAPYLSCDVRDIGTAGTSHWNLQLNVLSLTWKNGRPVKGHAVDIRDAVLIVDADSNTALSSEQGYSSHVEIPLDRESRQEGGGYAVSLSAASLNSNVAPNALCAAKVSCTGALTSRGIRFDLSAQMDYVNNLS